MDAEKDTTLEELKERNKILKAKFVPKKVEPEKRKSAMQVLCDWTQLVTQQNYLEANLLKLKPEDYEDFQNLESSTTGKSNLANQITDINNLRERLSEELKKYHEKARNDVEDFRVLVRNLKEDVFEVERLRNISLPSTLTRIVAINSKLDQLKTNNTEELKRLKNEEAEFEAELKPITDFYF